MWHFKKQHSKRGVTDTCFVKVFQERTDLLFIRVAIESLVFEQAKLGVYYYDRLSSERVTGIQTQAFNSVQVRLHPSCAVIQLCSFDIYERYDNIVICGFVLKTTPHTLNPNAVVLNKIPDGSSSCPWITQVCLSRDACGLFINMSLDRTRTVWLTTV